MKELIPESDEAVAVAPPVRGRTRAAGGGTPEGCRLPKHDGKSCCSDYAVCETGIPRILKPVARTCRQQPGCGPRPRPRGPGSQTLIPRPIDTTKRSTSAAARQPGGLPRPGPASPDQDCVEVSKAVTQADDAEVLARDGATFDLRRRAVRRSCSLADEPRPRPRDLDLQRDPRGSPRSARRSASVMDKGTTPAPAQQPPARTAAKSRNPRSPRTARARSTRTTPNAEGFHPHSNGDSGTSTPATSASVGRPDGKAAAFGAAGSWSAWLSRKREEERLRKEVQRRQDALEEQRLAQDRQFERECAQQNYRQWLQAKLAQRRREQLVQSQALLQPLVQSHSLHLER